MFGRSGLINKKNINSKIDIIVIENGIHSRKNNRRHSGKQPLNFTSRQN